MKVIVYYRKEGAGWAITMSNRVGISIGYTVYPTKEDAIQVAKEKYPDTEIVVQKQTY
jgi:hypothetical protein